jgi:hypothetical protein
VDNKFERVKDEKDPDRCQGIVQGGPNAGQCYYKAVAGSKFCPMHCGRSAHESKKNELKNYQLRQYRDRVGDLANSSAIKDLREEIGIVRMVLETLLNQCDNANKLIMYTGQISNLVAQVTKLVQVCQSIEERNNNLLDRKVVIVIADSLVTLVSKYVTDPDQLNEIGAKLVESIELAASPANPVGAVA